MTDEDKRNPGETEAPSLRLGAKLTLEFLSIVVGVLLALGLSEWADDREHLRLADTALVNIGNEIDVNHEVLRQIHDNNVTTIELINDADADASGRNIIPGMQLQETAWEAFLATGLSAYVDYDELLALSNLYSMQRIYKQTGSQLSQAVMNATAYSVAMDSTISDAKFQGDFVVYFQLLTTIETQLLDAYAAAGASSEKSD